MFVVPIGARYRAVRDAGMSLEVQKRSSAMSVQRPVCPKPINPTFVAAAGRKKFRLDVPDEERRKVEAEGLRLSFRPRARLAEDEKRRSTGSEARRRGRMGQEETAIKKAEKTRTPFRIDIWSTGKSAKAGGDAELATSTAFEQALLFSDKLQQRLRTPDHVMAHLTGLLQHRSTHRSLQKNTRLSQMNSGRSISLRPLFPPRAFWFKRIPPVSA
jgi:hypothetical protein